MQSQAANERISPAPKVLGILSLVFGGVVILMSLIGFSIGGASSMEGLPGAEAAMNEYLTTIEPWASLLLTAMLVMSGTLVVIGVGQLGYKRWARKAAITWGIAGIVVVVGTVLHHYLNVVPSFHLLTAVFADTPEVATMMEGMTSSAGILSVVMYAPYPIINLVLMRKPTVVAAMNR